MFLQKIETLKNGKIKFKVFGGEKEKSDDDEILEKNYLCCQILKTNKATGGIETAILQNTITGKYNLFVNGRLYCGPNYESDIILKIKDDFLFCNLDKSEKNILDGDDDVFLYLKKEDWTTFLSLRRELRQGYAKVAFRNHGDTLAIVDGEGHIIEGDEQIKTILEINKEPMVYLDLPNEAFRDLTFVKACQTAVKNAILREREKRKEVSKAYETYVKKLREFFNNRNNLNGFGGYHLQLKKVQKFYIKY